MGIDLVGPDGREYVIDDPAKLPRAIELGYRQVTPEAPRTLGETLKAGANESTDIVGAGIQGALQGATAGLAGAAIGAPKLDSESEQDFKLRHFDADELKRRGEEHPIARTVGEVAGMVGSPLGKIQGAITEGIGATTALGRIGAEALGGSALGTLYGAGNTLSDAALGDHDLTAEKLFAGAGLGAVLGGAGGGLGSALGEGVSAAAPMLGDILKSSKGTIEDFATSKALKAAGATQRDLDYLGADKAKEVGQMLLDRGHLGNGLEAPTAAGVLRSVSAEKEAVGQQLGKVFEDAHAAGAQPSYSNFLNRLDDFEAKLSPLERKAVAGEIKEARNAVHEYEALPPEAEKAGFKGLNELKQNLQEKAKWSAADQSQAFAGGLKRQLSGVVRDELDSQLVSHLGQDVGAKFLETKKLYGLLAGAERVAEHGAERLGGNASFGLRDLGIAGISGLGAGDPVSAVVGAIASKVMRERGPGVIARLADSIAKSPRMAVAAQSFGTKLAGAAPMLGQYGPQLQRALSISPAVALATHMTMAEADPHYAKAAQVAGFLPETPEEHQAAMKKAGGLAGITQAVTDHDDALAKAMNKVVSGTQTPHHAAKVLKSQDFGAKRMRRDTGESHKQRVEEIRQLAADPSALIDRVTANAGAMAEVAPGVAGAMARTAHVAVAFLAQEAQVPQKAGPMAPEWVPTEDDIHHFSSALETVQDPMSVLKHAAAGTLTENQVRALGTVYPGLSRQIADAALEKLAENPKSVPYRARLMLSMLTGIDVDGTMSGEAIRANQAAIGAQSSKPSNGAPGATSGKNVETLSVANRTAMPNQRKQMESADA